MSIYLNNVKTDDINIHHVTGYTVDQIYQQETCAVLHMTVNTGNGPIRITLFIDK
jgi:hypothetical protein